MFRTTTDTEAAFSHFDANLLSSTDVLLDQELGGDWGNTDDAEEGEDAGFGDIYAHDDGGQANFSFTSEDPNSAGVAARPPGARSGGVGELSSPEATLKGTFSSLADSVSASRTSRHSVAAAGTGRSASPVPRNSRMSVDSSAYGRISPVGGARMSVGGARTASTALSPKSSAAGGSAFRQSMYSRALSIGGGDPTRASFGGQSNAQIGVSSPSKRLALRYIQATNAARAGEKSNAWRVRRRAHVVGAKEQEVYPDLAEVEAAMREVREKLRAEALVLARAKELEIQSRPSPFTSTPTMAVARSQESPLGSFSAGSRALGGSLESKYAEQQFPNRDAFSRNSDAPDGSDSSNSGVPTTTMDDLVRRVGTDHTAAAPDERDGGAVGVSAQLRLALDRSLKEDASGLPPSPLADRPQRYSFSSESEATLTSHNSSLNNLAASYSQSYVSTGGDMGAYERANMLKRAGGVNPLANARATKGIADTSSEPPVTKMFASLEAAAAAEASDTSRNSFSIRPSEARQSFSMRPTDVRMSMGSTVAGRSYANVAGSPRPSDLRATQGPRDSNASTVATTTTAAGPAVVTGNAMDSQSYEEIAGPPNTYVGDPDYRNLSVVENMDLYMKEQVFNVQRPSGVSPYMRDGQPSESGSDKMTDLAEGFIHTANRYEKFITVFCEKVIDITGSAGGAGGAGPGTPPRAAKSRRDQLPRPEEQALAAQEETRYLVLTDTCLYLVRIDFPVQAIFSDAPVPTVIRAHKLYSLWYVFGSPLQ
jgi:hypothetical protein